MEENLTNTLQKQLQVNLENCFPKYCSIALEDLKMRFHEFTTTHQKGDAHETAFFEGQRTITSGGVLAK